MDNIKLCIFAPSKKSYSETFIHAHKRLNNKDVVFAYGALALLESEISGRILSNIKRLYWKSVGIVFKGRKDYDSFKNIQLLVKANNINVALLEYGTYGSHVVPYLKELNIPFIVHFHGYDASSYNVLRDYKNAYLRMFEMASNVVVVSRVMERKLLELGCPRTKLIYNVYGPNEIYSEIEPNYDSQQFIGVGRFVDKKAPLILINSFSKALEFFPSARMVMVGDGPLFEESKKLIDKLGIEDSVILTGRKSSQEIKELLGDSMAFVQHSITAIDGDMEGTPLSILESSSAGLPVISTIHAGIPDVILHGETGFLVEENDEEGMTKFMLKLLEDRILTEVLGKKGKQRIKESFTLERHLSVLDSLIKKAVY